VNANSIRHDGRQRMRMIARASIRRMIAAATVAMLLLCAAPFSAQAQIVALVNGEAITQFDIQQRTRLIQISTQKVPSRQEVLDELIEDKLKVLLAKRYISEVPKREIESTYANLARRAGLTPDQFSKMIAQSGISVDALKARIHADFVWAQIIRGKFRASLQVGEQEVAMKMQGNQKQDAHGFEYTLRPILFLVPRGASPAAFEARKHEAENLRARFQSCNEGLRIAMAMPDVAVREAIVRPSADLGQQQREVLNNTPVGRLTPPEVTLQGVEFFAVCNRVDAAGGETAAKREARDALYQDKYQTISKKYLKELRSQALIEIR
jgi:peptidyl-prolyl cis-trans isomerase SurA